MYIDSEGGGQTQEWDPVKGKSHFKDSASVIIRPRPQVRDLCLESFNEVSDGPR